MKKIIFTLIVAICSMSAFAQVTFSEDTAVYVLNAGCLPKNNLSQPADVIIKNNGTSAVTVTWSLGASNLLQGWSLTQFCDPLSCRLSSDLMQNPGPYSFNLAAGASGIMTLDIKGGSTAADGTNYYTINTSEGDIVYKFTTCPLGTKDFDNSNFVNIYPNPATNNINIALNDKNISSVNVMNLIGKKIAKFAVDANRSPINVPLDNVSNGVYLLQFADAKGRVIGVKKVTKQ